MNDFAPWPVALYGVVLLFAAIAYFILVRALIALHGSDSSAGDRTGRRFQGQGLDRALSGGDWPVIRQPGLASAVYVLVAVMWLIPDRRIEKTLTR